MAVRSSAVETYLDEIIMKNYFIYILECSDGLLYTGITNDLTRRIEEHELGRNTNCFTFKRRPIKLIFHQTFNQVEQAIYFEKKIKKWSAAKKRALYEGQINMLKILAECRNFTHHKYCPTKEEVSTALDQTIKT